jgi:hypothetical protein
MRRIAMTLVSSEFRSNIIVRGEGAVEFMAACSGEMANYYFNGKRWEENPEVEFTFNALVPVPYHVIKKGMNAAGFSWQIENWGSALDSAPMETPLLVESEESDLMIDFVIETFTAAPVPWVKKCSEQFPELGFEILFAGEIEAFDKLPIKKLLFRSGEVVSEGIISKEEFYYSMFLHKLFPDYVSI